MGLIAKNVMLALLMSFVIIPSITFSQACNIVSAQEPDMIFASRYPGTTEEINHFLANKSWEGLENARVEDDEYLQVELERFDRTHVIRFSNFGFNVPELATVDGLRVSFNGQSIGEGMVRQMQLQLHTTEPVGEDRSQLPSLLGNEWINDTLAVDRWWSYGYLNDTWGRDWSAAEINDTTFGFILQIENQTEETIQAIIDQVRINVYYTPPFNICDHECVVFSTDPIDGITNFNWTFPSIFEQVVSPVNQEILNLNLIDNITGSYEVCVTPEGQSQCCRDFEIIDCTPGSVGNRVWKDTNINGIQDPNEIGIPGIRVQLFDESGFFLEDQFTDNNGNYRFSNLSTGNYRIKTSPPNDDCNISESTAGTEDSDSDYDLAFGPSTSGVFHIEPGQNRDDIDFGWTPKYGSISGCTFRDRDGDSLVLGDPGIEGIIVQLHSCDGTLIASTTTNADGIYTFESLIPGQYFVSTVPITGFISASGGDSAFGEGSYSTSCIEVMPNSEQILKLGFIPLGSIGDFVFDDENRNGLQDEGDWPLENVIVSLLDEGNNVLSTTATDIQGNYLFTNLPSGTYFVVVNYPSELYLPTIANTGDTNLDSEGVDIGNQQVQSSLINLFDGESALDHDFGFFKRVAEISGTYFRDSNGDGILLGEQGIPDVLVSLYNCNSTLIATRITDANGAFSFTSFVGLDYYLVFTPVDGMETSIMGESAIDNVIAEGATACFNVPNENPITIDGASIPLSRVGNMVWQDTNRNGLFDQGEPGMPNVMLTLFNSDDQPIATTLTNDQGIYIFENLLPDLCYMEIEDQIDFEITDSNIGTDETIDSDGILANNVITTSSFLLEDGAENMDMDFGFRRSGGEISGVLWNDGNGDLIFDSEGFVENRSVSLFTCGGDLISSTITNNEGAFSFSQILAGDYYIVSESIEGFIHALGGDSEISNEFSIGSTSCITVANGTTTEITIGSIPTSTIGDFVWRDQNQNGLQDDTENGLADVRIRLLLSNGTEISSTVSDANGAYFFADIAAGNYSLEVELPIGLTLTESGIGDPSLNSEGIIQGGFVLSPNVTLRDGIDQNNHDFGFYSSTGNLNGNVWRDSNGDGLFEAEFGFEGIAVTLYSCDLVLLDSQITDIDGNYFFSNIAAGDYFVVPSLPNSYEFATGGDSQISNVFMPGSTACVSISSNNSPILNLGLIPLSTVGDYVWFDEDSDGLQGNDEIGFEGLDIGLLDDQGALLEVRQTDSLGQYSFENLRPGQYTISVMLPGEEYIPTTSLAGDPALDSEGTLNNGILVSNIIVLNDGINQLDRDFGFIKMEEEEEEPELGTVGGFFRRDREGDGILSDEPGIANQVISLKSCDGTLINMISTDAMGNFIFPPVAAGDYYLVFPGMLNFRYLTFGESLINNTIEIGATECFTVTENNLTSINGGSIPLNSIGNFVWNDANQDGIQDEDEEGLADIVIELYDSNNQFVVSTTSDGNGFYQFTGILPGDYFTSVIIGDYSISPANIGSEDLDSDISEMDGLALALVDNLYDGITVDDIDYGLFMDDPDDGGGNGSPENILNGIVFEDVNGNGVFDGGEPRINGIEINLMTISGSVMDNTTSSASNLGDGYYEFIGFPNGEYTVVFDLDEASFATAMNEGNNTGLDSDIVLNNGEYITEILDYTMGGTLEGVNAGYYFPVSLGDFVWFDFNADGIQDSDEPGANDYIIRLYNESGTQLSMTTTKTNVDSGQSGYYSFENLSPGNYYIGINLNFGTSVSDANIGDDNLDSDIDNSNGAGTSSLIAIDSGDTNTSTDIGLLATPGSVGDFLWVDNNGNGIQDNGEPGMNDVVVKLYDENVNLINETITGNDDDGEPGYYTFENITAGDYFIAFELPEGYLPTAAFRGGNSSSDSDITGMIMPGSSNIFTVGTGVFSDDIDCGIYRPSSVGDYVWDDKDKNGIQKFGEFGISDVEIILFREDEGEIERTTTDMNGGYSFEGLRPGEYYFMVEMQDDFQFSPQEQGTNPSMDSNVDMTGTSDLFFLDQEEHITNLDVGLVPARARLGGRTWIDDGNGLQDFNEENLTGITVNLLDSQLNLVQSTETNLIGRYTFTNLMTANYFIEFELPGDYSFTMLDASFNDFEDSDVKPSGLTDIIAVDPNTNSLSIDAGFIFTGHPLESEESIVLTGFYENGSPTLSWHDDTFISGDNYAILKSYDGIDFELIDQFSVVEESRLWYFDQSYSMVAQDNYYKVQKYDGDKMISESNIWKNQYLSKYAVNAFPIPSNEVINLSFDLPLEHDVDIRILDIFGNEVQNEIYENVKPGNAHLSFALNDMPNGNYIMLIDFGIVVKTKKIAILR